MAIPAADSARSGGIDGGAGDRTVDSVHPCSVWGKATRQHAGDIGAHCERGRAGPAGPHKGSSHKLHSIHIVLWRAGGVPPAQDRAELHSSLAVCENGELGNAERQTSKRGGRGEEENGGGILGGQAQAD
eukprot:791917-Ditylum_brightwellii.AAC.1